MKQKKQVGENDIAYVGGMCAGLFIMYLTWWIGTGFQHPGLIFGGGLLLLAAGIGSAYVKRKARRK